MPAENVAVCDPALLDGIHLGQRATGLSEIAPDSLSGLGEVAQ